MQGGIPPVPDWRTLPNTPEFDITRFGARDGAVSTSAIQQAVDAAEAAGGSGRKGGKVKVPPGRFFVDAPIYLPRTGSSQSGGVTIEGAHRRASTIMGLGSTFSTAATAGVFMWDATTAQAYHNRIANLCITAASVAGAKCIYHKANGTISNAANAALEWLECDLDNLYLVADNTFTEVMIDLEVGARYSRFVNLVGDTSQGTSQTYSTMLLRTRYQFTTGGDPQENEDSIGLGFCHVSSLHPMRVQGGWCRVFEGRIYNTNFSDCFSNGMRSGHTGSDYHFLNSFGGQIRNLGSEGNGGNPIFKFTRCRSLDIRNLAIPPGDPTDSAWTAATLATQNVTRVVPTKLKNATTPTTKRYFLATVGGTTGGTEPTWGTPALNDNIADGTVTWTAKEEAVGNSVEFVDCDECVMDGRCAPSGLPTAQARLTKMLTIDASSAGIDVTHFNLNCSSGTVGSEVTNSGTNCAISGRASGTAYTA